MPAIADITFLEFTRSDSDFTNFFDDTTVCTTPVEFGHGLSIPQSLVNYTETSQAPIRVPDLREQLTR